MSTTELSSPSLAAFIPSIPPHDRLWLEVVRTANLQNRRLTTREIWSQLRYQLPRGYDPQGIDRRLIHPNHEEITLLGLIALTESEDILNKGDQVMEAMRTIVLDNPAIQVLDTDDIVSHTGLPLNEVGLLVHFLYQFERPFESYGNRTPGFFGAEFVTFNRYNDDILRFTSMRDLLIIQLTRAEQLEEQPLDDIPGATTATQALAFLYLLKGCGIDGREHLTDTARFIQFFTCKETGAARIQDTNIYKRVRDPLKRNDKFTLQDLQTIRPYFVNLGLQAIINLIDKEIAESQRNLRKE